MEGGNHRIYREPITPAPPPEIRDPRSPEEERVRGTAGLDHRRLAGKSCVVGQCRNNSPKGRLFADILGEGRVYGNSIGELEQAVLTGPVYRVPPP